MMSSMYIMMKKKVQRNFKEKRKKIVDEETTCRCKVSLNIHKCVKYSHYSTGILDNLHTGLSDTFEIAANLKPIHHLKSKLLTF